MAGSYPKKIKELPLYDGRFDAYKLNAQDCEVLFASYPAGTEIPAHSHDTENHGVITKGELLLTIGDSTQKIACWPMVQRPSKCSAFGKIRSRNG